MPQASNASNLEENRPTKASEYVDLIDVIVWIWKSKVWTVSGALIGLAAAVTVAAKKPLAISTTVLPVVVESPGLHTPDRVLNQFYQLINRSDFQELVVEHLGEAKKSLLLDEKAPFQLSSSFGLFNLEIRQYETDPDGLMQIKIAKAFTNASRIINERIEKQSKQKQENLLSTPKTDIEITLATLGSSQAQEEAPLHMQLFLLEQKISQKLGIQTGSAPTQSRDPLVEKNILKLLAIAGGKISEPERIQLIKEYSTLVGQLKSKQMKYGAAFQDLSVDVLTISKQLIEHATQSAGKVLVLSLDEEAYKSLIRAGKHIRLESRKLITYTFSFIFGGLFGFIIYAAKRYLQQNLEYLKIRLRTRS